MVSSIKKLNPKEEIIVIEESYDDDSGEGIFIEMFENANKKKLKYNPKIIDENIRYGYNNNLIYFYRIKDEE